MLILIVIAAVVLLWIGVGLVWLHFASPSAGGHTYRRTVAQRRYRVGERVEVVLDLQPAVTKTQNTPKRDVILAIDHSASMGGTPGSPLREATRAARNFVKRLPPTVHVGVVEFDHRSQLLCGITGDHEKAGSAIAAIGPGGGTAIGEAIDCAAAALDNGHREGVPVSVVLLSDGCSSREAADAAAARLKAHPAAPELICLGFGSVDEALMRSIAGAPDDGTADDGTPTPYYIPVKDVKDFDWVFEFLSVALGRESAVSGRVVEDIPSPDPLDLKSVGGLFAAGVEKRDKSSAIQWSLPAPAGKPIKLEYTVVPECPGWHSVATRDSRAVWKMPDGSSDDRGGPRGPRILVLPSRLAWLWPVLNPLFWTLFGRRFCKGLGVASAEAPAPAAELPESKFPELPPKPAEPPYRPELRPSVVIGVGPTGEWALCHLKDRLNDRSVPEDLVPLRAIRICATSDSERVCVGETRLERHERHELMAELRGWVEKLRGAGDMHAFAWVPWQDWLADPEPLVPTAAGRSDRRKARLTLMLRAAEVETDVAALVSEIRSKEGIVIVVGAAGDLEGSGLMGEMAHVVATAGAGATVMLARMDASAADATAARHATHALALELERAVLMADQSFLSDRTDPPAQATAIIDRVIVVPCTHDSPSAAGDRMAELIWAYLAYDSVAGEFPATRGEGATVP